MNAWRGLGKFTGVLLAAFGVASGGAQTTMYLTPAKYTTDVGEQVAVRAEAGQGAALQRLAWPTEEIDWLLVRAPGAQTNREDLGPAQPGGDFVNLTPTKPGVTLIGLDTKPQLSTIPAKQFGAFMRRVMAPQAGQQRAAVLGKGDPVRVRRVESAKALIRVRDSNGKPASHSAVAQSKTGQVVEIRALADPTMVAVGSDLPVRAYVLGSKRVGVRMLATCAANGQTHEAITDASGSSHFRIDSTGVWRVEFHDLRPVYGDAEAEWVIYSATLTFEVTRTGAGK